MDQQELTGIERARRGIFSRDWFGQLYRGELSLGDTFWIGNFGTALVLAPAIFAGYVALIVLGAGAAVWPWFLGLTATAVFVHFAFLACAVFIAATQAPEAGGWRWAGVAITVANAAGAALFAIRFLSP
ncbi:hypothetical protein [Tropicimonas sp.]|uniref:hypothetical protein n=1 Tax=Tropicimonas sp. TaxID=2067044 RepID=UPI003A8354F3